MYDTYTIDGDYVPSREIEPGRIYIEVPHGAPFDPYGERVSYGHCLGIRECANNFGLLHTCACVESRTDWIPMFKVFPFVENEYMNPSGFHPYRYCSEGVRGPNGYSWLPMD